jgi:hypothetical protein
MNRPVTITLSPDEALRLERLLSCEVRGEHIERLKDDRDMYRYPDLVDQAQFMTRRLEEYRFLSSSLQSPVEQIPFLAGVLDRLRRPSPRTAPQPPMAIVSIPHDGTGAPA